MTGKQESMNGRSLMGTQELIEHTMLHALGLLDDDERELYERSMVAAPATIRASVLDEARRMADLGDLLPPDEPAPELREMVLSAVRAAIREQENEQRIAGSTPVGSASVAESVAGRIEHAASAGTRRAQPRVSRTPKVHRFWRASTIGLAAALIVVSVVSINNMQQIGQIEPETLVMQLYDNIGAEYLEDTIFDANTRRVAMVSSDGTTNAVAAVWSNPDWDSDRLFVKNLRSDDGSAYRLVVLDDDDHVVREVASFTSSGEFESLEVSVNLAEERRFAIYKSVSGSLDDSIPMLSSIEMRL